MPSATETLIANALGTPLGGVAAALLPRIKAFGVLGWTGAAFVWYYNKGFVAVGAVGEPVHTGAGNWNVTIVSPGATPFMVPLLPVQYGSAIVNGPIVAGVAHILSADYSGADSAPAGWAPGAVLGAPVPTDFTLILIALDLG